jgi:hypothetical protein
MISNTEQIKDEVFSIIKGNNNGLQDDGQFCFACGVALMALLYIKDDTDSEETSISSNVLNSSSLLQLKENILDLVKQNLDYVEKLPLYKKNLFTYITKYEPSVNELHDEYSEYLTLGSQNLSTFFESELVKLAVYAKIYGVTSSTIRYHIAKNNLKTALKVGRRWVINVNEPYPDNRAKII